MPDAVLGEQRDFSARDLIAGRHDFQSASVLWPAGSIEQLSQPQATPTAWVEMSLGIIRLCPGGVRLALESAAPPPIFGQSEWVSGGGHQVQGVGALAGRLHVTGGEALSSVDVYGEHEAYDTTADRWTAGADLPTPRADLPTPRHGLASAVLGERWYVIGGGTRGGALTFISLTGRVEVLGPADR
jgi:hypothetical protein